MKVKIILFCSSLLAILAFIIITVIHGPIISPAYARCSEQEVRTGTCKLPDDNDNNNNASQSSSATTNQTIPATSSSSSSSIVPETLQECSNLGIKPKKCSEQAILSKRCIGPVEGCSHPYPDIPRDPNINLIPIYLGVAGAFAAGIIYVKKTGGWKPKTS